MRDLTDGQESLTIPGETLRQVVNNLDRLYPGCKNRLCEDGQLRPSVTAAVDGETTQTGLLQSVRSGSEVHFVPAISGG